MNKNVRVIYKKVTENLKKKGYININHRPVNTLDELVDIASIFRSPEYETFRIIYMKDNNIAGYESISSKTPMSVPVFRICCFAPRRRKGGALFLRGGQTSIRARKSRIVSAGMPRPSVR